jgi:DNA helicase-2/ATP-dependent DNA helicase PcrA
LFTDSGTQSVIERSKKIFYVCRKRAKENPAVFFHTPPASVLEVASSLFGHVNVINLE